MPFFNRLVSGNAAHRISETVTGVRSRAANRLRETACSVVLAVFTGAAVSQAQQVMTAHPAAATGVKAAASSEATTETPKSEAVSTPGITSTVSNVSTVTVHLIADGKERLVSTSATTVGRFLSQEHLRLSTLDRCSRRVSDPVKNGMEIRVVRVRIEKTVEKQAIPFATRQRYTGGLSVGTKSIVTPGKIGARVVVYQDSFKDGKRTSRVKISEKVTKPRTQVVLSGVRGMTLASRGYFANKRVVEMVATGYGPGENGGWGNQTASGLKPGRGVVAVDPRFIPLGTRLYVEGYGYCVAGDTGGAIKGNRIDLGMDSRWEASEVGRRRVKVLILD